jgi:hypothetical protein
MMFGCVSEHFPNLRHVKEAKLFFEHECTISGYQSCEASILVYWTQNDVWKCVSEHFAKLGHVKRIKTSVSSLNALFRGTEVVKRPFYSIGPIMIFGCVSKHFADLRHVKDAKLVFETKCTILGYQSCEAILDYWTENDVCVCFEAFC